MGPLRWNGQIIIAIGNGEENSLISHYIFLILLPHFPFSRLSILNFLVVLLGQVSYAYLSHMSQFWIFERTDLTCERWVSGRFHLQLHISYSLSSKILVAKHSLHSEFVPGQRIVCLLDLVGDNYASEFIRLIFYEIEIIRRSVACEMQFFTLFTVGFFAYVK